MSEDFIQDLPLAHRLALAYAPAKAREDTLTLLALDARLSGILRQQSETIIAQIKLAWWRDRLAEDRGQWPRGEPLLARLAGWRGDTRQLVPLVDGWEALLAEDLDPSVAEEFARGRASGWGALNDAVASDAATADVKHAAREWALVDLALHLGEGEEREAVTSLARTLQLRTPKLPRALRPLAVLHGLARRALARGSGEMLDGPSAMLAALRIGLSGR